MTKLTVLPKTPGKFQVRDDQGNAWAVMLNGTVSCSCGKPVSQCPHVAAVRRWQAGGDRSKSPQDGRTAPSKVFPTVQRLPGRPERS